MQLLLTMARLNWLQICFSKNLTSLWMLENLCLVAALAQRPAKGGPTSGNGEGSNGNQRLRDLKGKGEQCWPECEAWTIGPMPRGPAPPSRPSAQLAAPGPWAPCCRRSRHRPEGPSIVVHGRRSTGRRHGRRGNTVSLGICPRWGMWKHGRGSLGSHSQWVDASRPLFWSSRAQPWRASSTRHLLRKRRPSKDACVVDGMGRKAGGAGLARAMPGTGRHARRWYWDEGRGGATG
jgi:hypothetical protein